MKLKSIVIAVAVLAILSGIAYRLNRSQKPAESNPRVGRPLVEPAAIAGVQRIHLSDQGKTLNLSRQQDGTWVDDGYFGLPADFSKLSSFVADLTGAKVQRLVTENPARLARLEFKDSRIEFLDSSGRALASVTLGKMGERAGRFVRFGNEPRAYFSDLNLWLDLEPKGWALTTLVDLKPDAVSRLEIGFSSGTPVVAAREKKGGVWKAEPAPAGQVLKEDKVSSVLGYLGSLRFSDTSEPSDPKAIEARAHSRTLKVSTFDGTIYTVVMGRKPEEKKPKAPAPKPPEGKAKDQATATAKEPEFETIPAGPVYVWVTSSDAKAPVNALMARRSFQIDDYVFTGLPEKAADLFEPGPSAPPPEPQKKG